MTPAEVATALKVEASTLRRWAGRFATLLSSGAQQPTTPGAQRVYSEADVAMLRQVQQLLSEGHTTAQILAQLGGAHDRAPDVQERVHGPEQLVSDAHDRVPVPEPSQQIVILDEHRPELEGLRGLMAAQQQLISQQEQHIADQAALLVQHKHVMESLERQVEQGQVEQGRLRAELDRARDEYAALLADTRRVLGKIPRWLRGLLGLGA